MLLQIQSPENDLDREAVAVSLTKPETFIRCHAALERLVLHGIPPAKVQQGRPIIKGRTRQIARQGLAEVGGWGLGSVSHLKRERLAREPTWGKGISSIFCAHEIMRKIRAQERD